MNYLETKHHFKELIRFTKSKKLPNLIITKCIKALLEGADPGITDCNGWSLAHYVVDNDKDETLRLLQELLQTETYQRNNVVNHSISISILNFNKKLTEYLLEGLWYISKKLLEVEESMITAEDNEIFRSLYHENSFGQTPTDIRAAKSFNLMVPKYLPRNQGNPLAMRVNVKFDADMQLII
ncbi:hypothetical protein RhiirA4_482599 [Rhizophagus irregularis]|uniref:Ankyrin repeat domain-containing protein n=1 Tax=Rhizophagus irregularis TaxID=588596 RepID=A0A2I1HLD7_9GLOM|nr:hypothetical protein RhiirA4_482599 [Rhizophagus irregularis]